MAKRAKGKVGMVRYSTFLRHDQLAKMRAIQVSDGVPVAEQIRRALDSALGTKPKPAHMEYRV